MEQNGPVNLFRFVINPNDFAQSVENLFYLSFLIRDGECALEIEEDGEPVICALFFYLFLKTPLSHARLIGIFNSLLPPVICEQPQFSDYQDGLKKQQLVFEFDVKTWEVGHHFLSLLMISILSARTICLGSDQNVQHYRSHHSTKIESGQLEWEVVRVMETTTLRHA